MGENASTEVYTTWLRNHEAGYTPNEHVAAQAGAIVMKLLVGPSCTGKSTVISGVTAARPDSHGRVVSFTTRPKRVDDDPKLYLFLRHDEETLHSIKDLVLKRELMQFAPHPTQPVIYGSLRKAYNKPNMLMDCLSTAVSGLERLPFQKVKIFGVVAEPEQWWQRFDTRYPEAREPQERLKRAKEAGQSVSWLLEHAADIIWVDSSDGALETAVHTVTTGESTFDGRDYAQGIAALAKQYIALKEGAST